MAKNIYRRYMWLVRTISQSRHGLTFNDINERWLRCPLNYDKVELSKRTFRNWISAISETLGIYIECTKSAPYLYYIWNERMTKDDLMAWALNAFSIGQMAAENNEIKERILLENIPSADERLDVILSAMRSNHRIRMTYKPFGRDELSLLTEPYAVKLSRKRWYVICHSEKNDKNYIYALDRIRDVEETDETFKMKKDYSAERDFDGCIGITAFEGAPIEEVRLKITGYLRDYIETLPLHPSQTLVEKTSDYHIYSYRLRSDYELVDIICGMGAYCEVISPQSLRQQVRETAKRIAESNK